MNPPELPLSPAQIRSITQADARINIWHGSIRSGKTIASLLAWVIWIATAAPTGGQLVIVGKTRETIERNVIAPLQDAALFGAVARLVSHTTGSNTAIILGRTVHLIGANDAKAEGKLRGLTCAGAYVDEATLLPEGFWNQLLGRCSVPGARIFATTNPDSPVHWLRKNFLQRSELDLRQFPFRLADNPSLTAEYVAAISAEYVGLWYRRFILGEWVAAEGAIFDQWDETIHTVDGDLPQVGRWWLGIDYGTTNPFAAVLLGLGSDGVVYAVDEWRYDSTAERRQLTDGEYSTRLRAWLHRCQLEHGAVELDWVYVDPSAASFKTQLRLDGVDGVRDANNDVIDGIRLVSSALATGRFRVHRRCQGLVEEIPGYVWDPKATAKGEDKPLKVADHSIDAVRYGLMTGKRMWWREEVAA